MLCGAKTIKLTFRISPSVGLRDVASTLNVCNYGHHKLVSQCEREIGSRSGRQEMYCFMGFGEELRVDQFIGKICDCHCYREHDTNNVVVFILFLDFRESSILRVFQHPIEYYQNIQLEVESTTRNQNILLVVVLYFIRPISN